MKGSFAFILLVMCLAAPGRGVVAAQEQPAGLPRFLLRGGGAITTQSLVEQAEPAGFEPPTGDLLRFDDGSLMHGALKRMDITTGLQWSNPRAKSPIDLQPAHLDSIRFASADSVHVSPTARLHFVNGDDLFGSVSSLDNDHLVLSTWFAGALTIPRAFVQSITILSSNYSMVYDGPGDSSGWIVGNHNPESWTFRDGTFISGGPGTLGRDFNLKGSSTIEFDLAWDQAFQLLVGVYSDAVDRLNLGNSYVLDFTRDEVSLRRLDSSGHFPFRNFGTAPMPNGGKANKVHIAIQSNKDEGAVAVFVDDALVKRWKDENGFSASGTGVLFQSESATGATLKLSDFSVSQWQGRYEPETSGVATNADVIRFINHDQASGKITGISGGSVSLAMGDTPLQYPIQRVTQINFAAAPAAIPSHGPWEVRARFPRGGRLSFQLEKWNDKQVSGHSAIFGDLALQPGQIRQLEFNLDHAKAPAAVVTDREFEGLDE